MNIRNKKKIYLSLLGIYEVCPESIRSVLVTMCPSSLRPSGEHLIQSTLLGSLNSAANIFSIFRSNPGSHFSEWPSAPSSHFFKYLLHPRIVFLLGVFLFLEIAKSHTELYQGCRVPAEPVHTMLCFVKKF